MAPKPESPAVKAARDDEERRAESLKRFQTHQRVEIDVAVPAFDGEVKIRTTTGRTHLIVGDAYASFDIEQLVDLRRKLDQAFQAVS